MALQVVPAAPGSTGRVGSFHRGDRLRKARESAGIQVQEMATRLEVERGTVTRYEKNQGVRRWVVEAYARATGYSEEWLQTGGGGAPDTGPNTLRYFRRNRPLALTA